MTKTVGAEYTGPKYTWLLSVCALDGSWSTICIDGDEARVGPNGVLYFFSADKKYTVAAFAPGIWRELSIMSQFSGEPNGWKVYTKGSLLAPAGA